MGYVTVGKENGADIKIYYNDWGSDVAMKAFRDGKRPFSDGTVIVALHWSYVPSEENNKVFGRGIR